MSFNKKLNHLDHQPKPANNQPRLLHELFLLSSHSIKPHILRQSIRKSIKDQKTLIDSNNPVFFRQGVSGGTCATAVPEFCVLANQPDRAITRLQINVSPALSLSLHQWHLIIRYCLFCLNVSNLAAIVLFPPGNSFELNLFLVSPARYSWEMVKAEDQKIVNQMIGLQMAIWYVKSGAGYNSMVAKERALLPTDTESPASFISWAIHKLLTVQRVETIHQLSEQLRHNYQIESDYLYNDYAFSRLRFRYDRSTWLSIEEILLHVYDLRIWLNFNRLARSNRSCDRILNGLDFMI